MMLRPPARQDSDALNDRVGISAAFVAVLIGFLIRILSGVVVVRRCVLGLRRIGARIVHGRSGVHRVDRADLNERGLFTARVVRKGFYAFASARPNLAGAALRLALGLTHGSRR